MKKNNNFTYSEFINIASEVINSGRFYMLKNFKSHSNVSVYTHSLAVAVACYTYVKKHNIKCDMRSLIYGALLHDYYLYDWHIVESWHRLHGFKHNYFALINAKSDYKLNKTMERCIYCHMFPLTFWTMPFCREAWIVSLMDKKVATKETLMKNKKLYALLYKKTVLTKG